MQLEYTSHVILIDIQKCYIVENEQQKACADSCQKINKKKDVKWLDVNVIARDSEFAGSTSQKTQHTDTCVCSGGGVVKLVHRFAILG